MAAALICGCSVATAQTVEPSQTLTRLGKSDDCTVYTFNYPSVNAAGEPTTLSSALFAWTPSKRQSNDSIESLHIYCHITITADRERPSTNEAFSKEQSLLVFLPGRKYGNILTGNYANFVGRCIVIAPDYEGYGVTKDTPHPYLSQRLTAQQVVDAVTYGLELYQKEAAEKTANNPLLPLKSDWRSFCMGYSQGGAVSLATHRQIEELGLADELHFQGSICGAGPYDPLTTMRYYLEDDGDSYGVETKHQKGKTTLPVVVPLILKGLCDSHPDMKPYGLESYLSQHLLDTGVTDWIDSKAYTTDEIASKWYDQLQTGIDTPDSHYTPEQMGELFESPRVDKVWGKLEKMFSPAVYDYMADTSHFDAVPETAADAPQALHRALADNSVATGWEPQHRIQFYHSKADMVVPYGNYLAFRDAHPQGEGSLYRIDDTFSEGDHMDAGVTFMLILFSVRHYADTFNWLCEGSATGITTTHYTNHSTDADAWYSLDGRRLSGRPTNKGIYINKGIKVVIK